jgi:hypothetical protein
MEARLMTYEELGLALNITPASAKRLAIRRKWQKGIGPDGKTHVSVPGEYLTAKPSAAPKVARGKGGDIAFVTAPLSQQLEKLEGEIERLNAKLKLAEGERDAEHQRANELAVQAAALEPLKVAIQTLEQALDRALGTRQQQSDKLGQKEEAWHQLATKRRGSLRWFKGQRK